MNNYFSTLLLIIFCNLHAARYEFEDGTKLDVPDTIVIHNDLGEDFRVYEMDRDHKGKCTYSGYRLFELLKSKKLVLHDMNMDIEVKLYEKCCAKRTYTLFYPTFTHDNECVTKGLTSVFEYNLSDIVNNNKNVQGHTIIKRVREYMEEVTTLAIGNKN